MALTNEELQDILDNLTPEEQKQLYDKEARKLDDLIKRDFAAQKPLEKCITDIIHLTIRLNVKRLDERM